MPIAKSTRVLTEARVRQIISALIRKETRKAFSSNLTDLLAVNTPIVIDNPGSASAAVGFDLNALTSSTPVVADELMIYDINLATERKITITNLNTLLTPLTDHGLLIGLGDNDHTQYVNAAGGGLSLAAQALSLDITGLSTATPVTTDELAFFDVDAAGERKMTIAAMAGILNLTDLGTIDHESLTGRADDDHSAYLLDDATTEGDGIRVENREIRVRIDTNQGLEFQTGNLVTNIGIGLTFSNGAIRIGTVQGGGFSAIVAAVIVDIDNTTNEDTIDSANDRMMFNDDSIGIPPFELRSNTIANIINSHLSGGNGIVYTNGVIAVGGVVIMTGNLDMDGNNIDTEGGNILLGGGDIDTEDGFIITDGGLIDSEGGVIQSGGGLIDSESGIIQSGGGLIDSEGGVIQSGSANIDSEGGDFDSGGGDLLLGGGVVDWGSTGVVTMRQTGLFWTLKTAGFDIFEIGFGVCKGFLGGVTFGGEGNNTYEFDATGASKMEGVGTGASSAIRFLLNNAAAGQFELTSGVATFTAPFSVSSPGSSLILKGGATSGFIGGNLKLRAGQGTTTSGDVDFEDGSGTQVARVDGPNGVFEVVTILDINAPIALGAGATALLGLIGSSGPATAAQNEWVQINVNGNTRWIAAWA